MIEWVLPIISIVGTAFNVKKMRVGFLFWIIGNIGWIYVNLQYEMYTQIPVWVVLTLFSIYGYAEWGKE